MQIQADCSLALLGGFPDLGGLLAVLAYLTPAANLHIKCSLISPKNVPGQICGAGNSSSRLSVAS